MTALAPSRASQAAQTALAALITTGIVIGLPWLLIAFADAPWDWTLPSTDRLNVALSLPPSTNTVKYALAITGWIILIWLIVLLAREIVAQLAGRRAAAPVRGPIRLLAAALVGGLTATVPALAAGAEPAVVVSADADQCQAESEAPAQPTEADPEPTSIDEYKRDAEGNIIHTVASGDTIWDLSIEYYGTPDYVDAIFERNVGISQPTGGKLTNKHRIWPDWVLVMPGTAPKPEPVVPADPEPPRAEDPPAAEPEPEESPTLNETDAEVVPTQVPNVDAAEAAPFADRGIWVAGSFLALGVLAAAVALARRRGRPQHGKRTTTAPEPTISVDEDDELTGRLPDLEDLLERQAAADSIATPLATGLEDEDEVSILDHADLGLGLTGPGADAAARACLYTAVLNAANVVCDRRSIEGLGLDPEVLAAVPAITVTDTVGELLEAMRRRQATLVFDEETDELYREAAVAFCDSDTAQSVAELLDDEHTFAVVLGEWEPHWLHLSEDGTPDSGNVAVGPIASLGQCYLLDPETGRGLFADLAEPDDRSAAITEPVTVPEPEPPLPDPSPPSTTPTAEPDHVAAINPVATATDQFQLQLFGAHRLTWNGTNVHFRNIRCLDLIAVMALTDWELSRDELTMVVAGDAQLKQAKSRRTSTTSRLNETLVDLTGLDKDQILTFDRSQAIYRLNPDLFATDVADFDHHLARAAEATNTQQRAADLDAALQRYVGPLGEALDEAWDLIDQRTTYQHRAYQAALDLAALHESDGALDAAASSLQSATTILPQETTAWEHLIDLHRRQGDNEAASQTERRRRQLQQLTAAARGK